MFIAFVGNSIENSLLNSGVQKIMDEGKRNVAAQLRAMGGGPKVEEIDIKGKLKEWEEKNKLWLTLNRFWVIPILLFFVSRVIIRKYAMKKT